MVQLTFEKVSWKVNKTFPLSKARNILLLDLTTKINITNNFTKIMKSTESSWKR